MVSHAAQIGRWSARRTVSVSRGDSKLETLQPLHEFIRPRPGRIPTYPGPIPPFGGRTDTYIPVTDVLDYTLPSSIPESRVVRSWGDDLRLP